MLIVITQDKERVILSNVLSYDIQSIHYQDRYCIVAKSFSKDFNLGTYDTKSTAEDIIKKLDKELFDSTKMYKIDRWDGYAPETIFYEMPQNS